eukprot:TRINITY_DN84465_c0_g1_i1.p1 TRINITY_DN84465_c0_g1~~TRINITY_DN84465_c0_g1_i1.p1  ORF type:complete len:333 (-),score=56.27 TRINITY_DN84465_c0_g1_i1:216-1214(-)
MQRMQSPVSRKASYSPSSPHQWVVSPAATRSRDMVATPLGKGASETTYGQTPRARSRGETPRAQKQSTTAKAADQQAQTMRAVPTPARNNKTPASTKSVSNAKPVWLHVYDLGPVSKMLVNSWAASNKEPSCMGVFHTGVEVLGVEFSFQAMADCGPDDDFSGLTWHTPKTHPRHVYRESICLGNCTMSVQEIAALLERLEKAWQARKYNCLTNNCTDFAEHFAIHLGTAENFPKWVHGIAKSMHSRDSGLNFGQWIPSSWTSCNSAGSAAGFGSVSHSSLGVAGHASASQVLTTASSSPLRSSPLSNSPLVEKENFQAMGARSVGCSLFAA